MLITFIRHSKTDQDPNTPIVLWGLTEEGIQRAKELSNNEDIKKIEVLYSSLQTKAIETALYLAKPNQIPMKFDDNLTEVTSLTKSFEPDFEKYTKQHTDSHNGVIERIDGGETLAEALERFTTALTEIVQHESAQGIQNIGIVSHGNTLGLFVTKYSTLSPLAAQKLLKMPDYAVFDWDTKQFIVPFMQIEG
jgi:broad specificity phosphatase PhoE